MGIIFFKYGHFRKDELTQNPPSPQLEPSSTANRHHRASSRSAAAGHIGFVLRRGGGKGGFILSFDAHGFHWSVSPIGFRAIYVCLYMLKGKVRFHVFFFRVLILLVQCVGPWMACPTRVADSESCCLAADHSIFLLFVASQLLLTTEF